MPSVFPESNSKAKIGPPTTFSKDSITQIPDLRLWVFRDEQGVYAISSICTHLGCTVARDDETGEFLCPCHGSKFAADGKVMAGPAPKGLNWLAMSVSPDGQIVVDTARPIPAGTRLTV
jgi:cytochrome b6-f complex iron-sulfur subunit